MNRSLRTLSERAGWYAQLVRLAADAITKSTGKSPSRQWRRHNRDDADARNLRERPIVSMTSCSVVLLAAPRLRRHAAEPARREGDLKDAVAFRSDRYTSNRPGIKLRLIERRVCGCLDNSRRSPGLLSAPLRCENIERHRQQRDDRPQHQDDGAIPRCPRASGYTRYARSKRRLTHPA